MITPARSVKLSAADWAALAMLATRYGLGGRSEVIRYLIARAIADGGGELAPAQAVRLALARLAETTDRSQ